MSAGPRMLRPRTDPVEVNWMFHDLGSILQEVTSRVDKLDDRLDLQMGRVNC